MTSFVEARRFGVMSSRHNPAVAIRPESRLQKIERSDDTMQIAIFIQYKNRLSV